MLIPLFGHCHGTRSTALFFGRHAAPLEGY